MKIAEIARNAWMEAPNDADHWAATVNAILEHVAKSECRECARGNKPRYDAEVNHFYHDTEAGELGCVAATVRRLQAEQS